MTWLNQIAISLSWALATWAAILSLYMLSLVIGSWLYRPRTVTPAQQPSITVLVPAHNEEQGISRTLREIFSSEYPQDMLRVLVIADNCTDRTAAISAELGAHVLVRADLANRGKGQALDWALTEHRHLVEDGELVVIVDADMSIDERFFVELANVFSAPDVLAVQGRYIVANPCATILSAIGYASFCYVNHVRPAGRCFWGGTAELKGSGMGFRSSFLLSRGWSAHSVAEDIQLGKELLLEGVRVVYAPAACVRSEIPSTLSQVRVQQSRWEIGKRQVFDSVFRRTFRSLRERPSVLLLDGTADLFVPPLSVIVLLCVTGVAASWMVSSTAIWICLFALFVFAAAVLSGLLQNRAPAGVYLRLLASPIFIAWKAVLLLGVAVSRAPAHWHRTPRDPL